jgi:hypothetical protein
VGISQRSVLNLPWSSVFETIVGYSGEIIVIDASRVNIFEYVK